MKKHGLIFSILILTFVFAAASANAQSVRNIDAKVPFSFDFGSKTYDAGNYSLRIARSMTGEAVVTLSDETGKSLMSIVAAPTNSLSDGRSQLRFGGSGGERAMTNIVLQDVTYMLATSNSREPAYTKNQKVTGEAKTKPRKS